MTLDLTIATTLCVLWSIQITVAVGAAVLNRHDRRRVL